MRINKIKWISIICIIIIVINIIGVYGMNNYKEGLEIFEDHGSAGFDKNTNEALRKLNKYDKIGFNLDKYKKDNPSDFLFKTKMGTSEKTTYDKGGDSKNEGALKRLWIELHKEMDDAKTNFNAANGKLNITESANHYTSLKKQIKMLISQIDVALSQMNTIYPDSQIVPLYIKLSDIKPILNGVINNSYLSSSKISKIIFISDGFTGFISYIKTTVSSELSKLQTELEIFVSLPLERSLPNVKNFLTQLRNINTNIVKLNEILKKLEDSTATLNEIKKYGTKFNVNQYIDNEIIQPEKRIKYPNAKW